LAKVLAWFFRLIPSFSFGYGVLNIGNNELFSLVVEGKTSIPSSLSLEVAGADIMYLGITGFLYFFLIFAVEKLQQSSQFNKLFNKENGISYVEKDYDEGKQKNLFFL
jgi:ATP-binding cassette, subfamily A (ABC1), member 3